MELSQALSSMHSEKILDLDGFTVEFFKSFEFLKVDLLAMVKESQKVGRVHGSLNSTFLFLIPKKENIDSFEDFRPISC